MKHHTLIDMFSGAGLFSAGMNRAGISPVLAIDVDGDAIQSYNKNVGVCGKIASATDSTLAIEADVLIAGPPCQGFSTLGRQDPLDFRNELSLCIPEWSKRSNASIVVVENVPPFLKSQHWQKLAAKFQMQGFEVFTWVLEASEFGAPQMRTRAFTIASKVGVYSAPTPIKERKSASVAFKPVQVNDPMHRWPIPKGIAAQRIPLIPQNGDKRDLMKGYPELCPPSWERVGNHATDVWGRIDPTKPSNTVRCCFQNPSKGRYLHPIENRSISLREGARLQGVPDKWTFTGSATSVARQIGNGVPVHLGLAVGKRIKQMLNQSPE